jgi:parvulin-like peptidyl-prolyl isomerase
VKVRILAVATAVLLTAGCSFADKAGAAAVVGDKQIPASKVADQVNLVRAEIENTPTDLLQDIPGMAQLSQMIVDRLVLEQLLTYAVAETGVKVTDAQVAEYRDTVFRNYGEAEVKAQLASRNGLAAEYVDQFMYDLLVQRAIMEQLAPGLGEQIQAPALYKYLSSIVKKQGVEVSPRYGKWDEQSMQTVTGENYLSTTQPAVATQ